jgi:ArsR family transcriptional regulator, arsenate/arsenite/antimonite-responsive transcriptional repressor
MDQERVLKAAADQSRLRILNLLMAAKIPLCVCELVDALKIPQYQISRHMQILKNAGLVCAEKQGTWAYHTPDTGCEANRKLFEFLEYFLDEGIFSTDRAEMESRLALRVNGRCVVGAMTQQKGLEEQ